MVPFALLFFSLKLGILPASGWPRDCNVVVPGLPAGYECIGVISTEAIIPVLALSLPASLSGPGLRAPSQWMS